METEACRCSGKLSWYLLCQVQVVYNFACVAFLNSFGKVENGRPEYWIGAHVKGKNDISLGVCLIGRDYFTKLQFSALEEVLKEWKFSYPDAKILGHRDNGNTSKTCPNFDVNTWAKDKFK